MEKSQLKHFVYNKTQGNMLISAVIQQTTYNESIPSIMFEHHTNLYVSDEYVPEPYKYKWVEYQVGA